MGDTNVQETGRTQAAWVACRVVRATVATHGVGTGGKAVRSGRAAGSSAYWAPFRVIEDIECFRSKFKVHALLHCEVLVQSHVEIPIARVA